MKNANCLQEFVQKNVQNVHHLHGHMPTVSPQVTLTGESNTTVFRNKSPAAAEMDDHNRHGPKIGGCAPFWGRGLGAYLTQSPGPRPTSVPSGILIHPAVWPQQTSAENLGCAPFGGAGSPSNTMWQGPRPTCVPSFVLIRPTVWLQYQHQFAVLF